MELVAFGLYGYIWIKENARMLTNDMGLIEVKLEGKLGMKKDHKRAIGLVFWVHTGETNLRDKSGVKRKQSKGENSAAPFQEIQVILMPFQVHFKSISSVHHVHEVP